MSRYQSSTAYNFKCRQSNWDNDTYIISWTVDFHYTDSRLRYPRRFSRDTDKEGAVRFCRKHNLELIGGKK